jgi:hypothetical protein
MEDVSKRIVAQVADRIRGHLEPATDGGPGAATYREPSPAKPVNAIGVLFSIVWERIKGWFGE